MIAALSVAGVGERVRAAGAGPYTSTPQEFSAFIHDEARKWARVIKRAKVTLE